MFSLNRPSYTPSVSIYLHSMLGLPYLDLELTFNAVVHILSWQRILLRDRRRLPDRPLQFDWTEY